MATDSSIGKKRRHKKSFDANGDPIGRGKKAVWNKSPDFSDEDRNAMAMEYYGYAVTVCLKELRKTERGRLFMRRDPEGLRTVANWALFRAVMRFDPRRKVTEKTWVISCCKNECKNISYPSNRKGYKVGSATVEDESKKRYFSDQHYGGVLKRFDGHTPYRDGVFEKLQELWLARECDGQGQVDADQMFDHLTARTSERDARFLELSIHHKFKEVAEEMGVSKSGAHAAVSRARAIARERLEMLIK